MVIDFGGKVIEVSCTECGWHENWVIINGCASRTVSCGLDGVEHEDVVQSNEHNIFGMARVPKRCPKCGKKTKRTKLPVVF